MIITIMQFMVSESNFYQRWDCIPIKPFVKLRYANMYYIKQQIAR